MTVDLEFPTSNWLDLEAGAQATDLVLIPVGAVEVYGKHMPQGTDGIVARALCQRLAPRVSALVAPLIPVGYSAGLSAFPTTLSVPPEALVAYTRGIVDSLLKLGLRRFLFINGHAGNVQPIDVMVRELATPERRFAQVDVWRFVQTFSDDLLQSAEFKYGHAGEAGTSVMLYLHPEYVKTDRVSKESRVGSEPPLGVSTPRNYRQAQPTGLLGDATLATAAKGEQIVNRALDALETLVRSPELTFPD